MKSSTLPQYTSNPSLINSKPKQQYVEDESTTSTYSFRHQTNKLPHAKSYGELYQPSTTLSMLSPVKQINDENKIKQREPSAAVSPVKMRGPATTTLANSAEQTQHSSPSSKIPFWKRFKKMIVPTKRTKEQQTSKVPALLVDELTESQSSTNHSFIFFVVLKKKVFLVDLTITDSVQPKLLRNPLKLSELKNWINLKTFPEDQIRAEYDVKLSIFIHLFLIFLSEIAQRISSSENRRTSSRKQIQKPFQLHRTMSVEICSQNLPI